MTLKKLILIFVLASTAPATVWAYGSGGGGSGKKLCDALEFSEFSPADKTTVRAGSEFSFKASSRIKPDSIKVRVKDQPTALTITPVQQGFRVKGMLPASLAGPYARIAIQAAGVDKCQGSGGWLVKIVE